ncbi:hypothetical protein O6H91_17G040500 [Diphasiastrum complanatum]|uniref:Uncharacterized protein n=2 Tax=Diphasiastrum complanatum TaxID=34168 RepID=A0ACC2B638_DIPCM|nr:hypothetical protein O6H91_17G040500 [Diphasiastrum complanatum]KAJ7525188.1 hypothetical protein O6H91_17G040500 [Diphasiastrum complanatum]
MIKQLEIAKYNNGLQGLRPEYQIKTLHKHNQVKKLNALGDSTRISAQAVSSHIPDMTDETSDEDERGSREESFNELIIKLLLVDREIRERGLEDFRPRCIFKESTHSDFYNISEE